MIIKVYTADGEVLEFEDAVRYATDEHNNLELYGGPIIQGQPPEVLMELFAKGEWVRVGISVEDDD